MQISRVIAVFLIALATCWSDDHIGEQCKMDPWLGGKFMNPAAKVRLNEAGIDLASQMSQENVTKFLKYLKMPDLKVLDLTIFGIHVSDFQPPKYFRKLIKPNQFRWGFDQGQLAITGGFRQTTRPLPAPGIRGGGVRSEPQNVEANVTVASGSTSMEMVSYVVKNGENKPTVNVLSCKATMGILNVTVTGNSALATISDMVKRMMIDQIQRSFQQMLCASVGSIIKDQVNEKLNTFPAQTKLDGNNLILDFGLTENPKVVNNDSAFEAPLKGIVYYRFPPVYPFYPPMLSDINNSKYMMDFLMTDHVLNTLLFTAFKEKWLKFEATPKSLSPARAKYLSVSCTAGELCLASIYSKVAAAASKGSYGKLTMESVAAPKITFVKDKALWSGNVSFVLEIVDGNKTVITKLFSTNTSCIHGEMATKIYKKTLYAVVNVTGLSHGVVESPWKTLDSNDMKKLHTIFGAIFEEIMNGILSVGFPIPLVDGMELVNPVVQWLPRTLYVGSNYTYITMKGWGG